MAVQSAAGNPQLSGTVVPNAIWSGKLLVKFYEATILSAISNTEYEGEIANQGDKVIIRTTPSIVISDYSKGGNLQTQRPEPETVELTIDKAKYWQFIADDIDKFQSDYAYIDDWTRDASEQLKITIDTDVLGSIYADAAAANAGATAGIKSASYNMGTEAAPVTLDKTNILDYIVDMGSVLDEQNVPESGRWLSMPVWACGLLKKSDLNNANEMGDSMSVLRNGQIGMIDRFTIYRSNLLKVVNNGTDNVTHLIAGHKSGLTFASQMLNSETLRAESTFGTLVRGLQVYGYKVVKSESIVDFVAKR